MDDRTFDEKTALDWIAAIETGNGHSSRDADIYPRLRAWADRLSPLRVLDMGCGQGICSEQFGENCHYTGVDPSPFLIARASERHSRPNRTFIHGNAYQLPFSDGTFDAAFSISVWHLLEDLASVSREVARVLRPAGRFLVITANPDSYEQWKAVYPDGVLNGKRFEGTLHLPGKTQSSGLRDVLFLHSRGEIERELSKAGLHVESAETFRPTGSGLPGIYLALEGAKAD